MLEGLYGSFSKYGDPNIDPIYYSPYYWDPQNGTPNFGKTLYVDDYADFRDPQLHSSSLFS